LFTDSVGKAGRVRVTTGTKIEKGISSLLVQQGEGINR